MTKPNGLLLSACITCGKCFAFLREQYIQPTRLNKDISRTKLKGEFMKYRKPTAPKKDKKIFHVTASKTKKINLAPKTMRGGIRL